MVLGGDDFVVLGAEALPEGGVGGVEEGEVDVVAVWGGHCVKD